MSETQPNPLSDTQPTLSETQPGQASDVVDTQPRKVKPNRWFFWIGLLIIVGAVILGGLGGYNSGIGIRLNAQKTTVASSLSEQMTLVQQDIDAGRYAVARQRLEEYILKNDPNFPGAAEKLTELLVEMSITPSPTPTPIPSVTPTPDLRAQEAIFAQAKEYLQNKDWSNTLATLDALRKSYQSYETAQVDDMYYAAFRNRGVDQIMGNGAYAQQTNLEGGIYDLTLAERFGPLDGSADGLRNFARFYIIGASFWELDWAQAKDYFAQVYQFTPNLRDASGVTATERYRIALLHYGDLQATAKKLNDRCQALDSWQQSGSISPLDQEYAHKFSELNQECHPPTKTPAPTEAATPEVTPTP
jgi:hypothetical protein